MLLRYYFLILNYKCSIIKYCFDYQNILFELFVFLNDVVYFFLYTSILIVVVIYPFVSAENEFHYLYSEPNYIVGNEIETNTPSITEEGSYTISPHFSKGLILDETNGYITGTPIEEYQSTFTVTFVSKSGDVKRAKLEIKGIIDILFLNSMG